MKYEVLFILYALGSLAYCFISGVLGHFSDLLLVLWKLDFYVFFINVHNLGGDELLISIVFMFVFLVFYVSALVDSGF
jgi:hypothetical protein